MYSSSLEAILTRMSHIPVVRGVGRNKIKFWAFFDIVKVQKHQYIDID
jgi:hypothetical protein